MYSIIMLKYDFTMMCLGYTRKSIGALPTSSTDLLNTRSLLKQSHWLKNPVPSSQQIKGKRNTHARIFPPIVFLYVMIGSSV